MMPIAMLEDADLHATRRSSERAAESRSSRRYPKPRSALLPLLHLVQSEEGYVCPGGDRVLRATARHHDGRGRRRSPTFYTMYKRRPVGDYPVGVCTNTLCAVMGGDAIFAPRSGAPRRRARRDHGRRQDHPGARRVQRGLRLRAGRDGQLGVLRQPDRRSPRPASWWTTCARGRAGDPDPRCPRSCTWREASPGRWPATDDGLAAEGPGGRAAPTAGRAAGSRRARLEDAGARRTPAAATADPEAGGADRHADPGAHPALGLSRTVWTIDGLRAAERLPRRCARR